MSFDDFLNNPIRSHECDNLRCESPEVRFLFHKPNGGVFKCCFSCWYSKTVKRSENEKFVTGEYSSFQRSKEDFMNAKMQEKIQEAQSNIAHAPDFYSTRDWLRVRYDALEKHYLKHGHTCLCCKARWVPLHVDHIKPKSKHPDLALEPTNLQVLCAECNLGKSNRGETDFRGPGGDAA